jgi:hypothetical protein
MPMLKANSTHSRATSPGPHRSARLFDADLWDDHHHPPGTLWQATNRLAGLTPKGAQRSRR